MGAGPAKVETAKAIAESNAKVKERTPENAGASSSSEPQAPESAERPELQRQDSKLRRDRGMNRIHNRSSSAEPEIAQSPIPEDRLDDEEDDNDGAAVSKYASMKVERNMLDPEIEAFLGEAFKKHFLLKELPESDYRELALHMKVKMASAGEVIVTQGDPGESVYFIRRGKFSVIQDGKEVSLLGPEDSFGELALLYRTSLPCTIKATEPGELWKMERARFLQCKSRLAASKDEAIEFFKTCGDFRHLSLEDQKALAELCTPKKFEDGTIVISKDEPGEMMYIVIYGKVSSSEDTFEAVDRGAYGKFGSVIGSIGVLYDKPQAIGAYAKGAVECLALSRHSLSNFSPAVLDVLRRSAFKALLHSLPATPGDPEPWRILSQDQLHKLISRAEDAIFEPGEIIFAPGDEPQMIIVVDGEMAILKQIRGMTEVGDFVFAEKGTDVRGEAERVLGDGVAYGKQPELLEGVPMSRFGVAVGKVRLHRITHTAVIEALSDSLIEVMRDAEIKRVLSDIFLFKNLREEQVDQTVGDLEQRVYSAGEVIVQQGDPARHFFLIQRGNVIVRKDETVLRTLGRWDYFGERGLLLQENRSATCQALDECICLALGADDFFDIVGSFKAELLRRMHMQDLNLKMEDLYCKAVVGRGTFGVVRLVAPKNKDDVEYALKCVQKTHVIKGRQERAIVMEKEVNAQCYHPCIMQFIKTFQDKNHVYFLTEFLGGGDLFYAIREIGALSKVQCQFFAGSIVLGIEYLHARGIMYRDLKPENVLLDFKGRAKLVDFGCCKRELRTSTVIGTPEYIAPEVIRGKGYTACVDWWSLGVMLYEFVVGPIPFGAGEEDQMKLFRAITEAPLTFPNWVAEDAVMILRGFLERRPDRRLGASSIGAKEIKEQPWYNGFDWDALAGGFFPPPYQPQISSIKQNWEEPDGDLMDHFSTESFTFPKGMEWAKHF